jgi:alkylation response protein AidB-like acyl-CoA dehydrogenase
MGRGAPFPRDDVIKAAAELGFGAIYVSEEAGASGSAGWKRR